MNDLDNSEEVQEVEIRFPFFSENYSRMHAYTIAYSNIDTMQDGFPGSILEPASFLSIKAMLTAYFRATEPLRSNDVATETTACGKRTDGKFRWTLEKESTGCEGKMIVSLSDIRRLIAKVNVEGDVFQDAKIPLNSLFLTSLSATTLLYVAAFFLFLSRQLFQKLIGGIVTAEDYFLKSPFAWVGLITGTLLFAISCFF